MPTDVEGAIELVDAQGVSYFISGSSSSGSNDFTEAHYTFMPPPGQHAGPPARLVYTTWTSVEHLVPFEFRDLPLP